MSNHILKDYDAIAVFFLFTTLFVGIYFYNELDNQKKEIMQLKTDIQIKEINEMVLIEAIHLIDSMNEKK